jgi:hypothetical protein
MIRIAIVELPFDREVQAADTQRRGLRNWAGRHPRPLPWCGVAVEDLRQEGAGTVFCVTCMPRGRVSGKAGSIEH